MPGPAYPPDRRGAEREVIAIDLPGFGETATSLDEALTSLVHGPKQQGAPAGSLQGGAVIGWGRQDKVTLPSQAKTATTCSPTPPCTGSPSAATSPTGTSPPGRRS